MNYLITLILVLHQLVVLLFTLQKKSCFVNYPEKELDLIMTKYEGKIFLMVKKFLPFVVLFIFIFLVIYFYRENKSDFNFLYNLNLILF